MDIPQYCHDDTVFLCYSQVYTGSWGDHDGVIKCQLSDIMHYELGEELEPKKEVALFDKPTRGTSVEKFKEMVASHLKVWMLFFFFLALALIEGFDALFALFSTQFFKGRPQKCHQREVAPQRAHNSALVKTKNGELPNVYTWWPF